MVAISGPISMLQRGDKVELTFTDSKAALRFFNAHHVTPYAGKGNNQNAKR